MRSNKSMSTLRRKGCLVKKSDVVRTLLGERFGISPRHDQVTVYAPSNIALCKYWGKRDTELNLPVTSSLSISLGNKGATLELSVTQRSKDLVYLNDQIIEMNSPFGIRLRAFYDLFRLHQNISFTADIKTNLPVGAGLASSACGFASVTMALNQLFHWELQEHELSILARLGSGSACRSLWHGFVEWHQGARADGMDCYAQPIQQKWPELCLGLLIFSDKEKEVSSREAMKRTVETSTLYEKWPGKVAQDLVLLKQAIQQKDFILLGHSAESNALTMHATMLSAWPPVCYALPETITIMKKIWNLRKQGLQLFFTQDAGANLKLLFLEKDVATVREHFPGLDVVQPFNQDCLSS